MSTDDFTEAMIQNGIDNIPEILPDGAIHRFPTWGDRSGELSGAYWYNGRCGWFQDWRSMDRPVKVSGKAGQEDLEALKDSLSGNANKVSRAQMLSDARRIWDNASESVLHEYIFNKQIKSPPGIKQHDDCLIIPLHDVNNQWNGLQRITAAGRKKFISGTRKKGSFFGIQGDKTRIIVCEGFATGVSIFMSNGASVAVAFDGGNLKPVAEVISSKRVFKEVIIAGDNDSWKTAEGKKDTGTAKAREAARAIGCKVVLPMFQNPDGKGTTDFNDLMVLEGAEVVKKQIDAAELDRETILKKAIADMVGMDPLDREAERNRLAKEYGIRKGIIDQHLAELIREKDAGDSKRIVEEIEPAADPVDGAGLLDEILNKLQSHLILPDGAGVPITLWAMLTYCYNAFRILPILGIVSPEKRCGKTTLLEFLQGVVSKGLTASNISPAAVFRTVEKYGPTLLIDEADTFLKDNDELRGILNSGHTRSGAFVVRSQGDDHEPVKFSTWGPKAVASIKALPGTVGDRSIIISLSRKMTCEKVEKIGLDFDIKSTGIRSRFRRWADDHMSQLKSVRVSIPNVGNDRAEDNWTPLFSIAEVIGGDWPEMIRAAMLTLHDYIDDDDSIGPMLLDDIKGIFDNRLVDKIFSDELVRELTNKKERPWADWNRGKGLTQNGLAKLLKPFGVKSKQVRIHNDNKRGYLLDDFKESFSRYLENSFNLGNT